MVQESLGIFKLRCSGENHYGWTSNHIFVHTRTYMTALHAQIDCDDHTDIHSVHISNLYPIGLAIITKSSLIYNLLAQAPFAGVAHDKINTHYYLSRDMLDCWEEFWDNVL